MEGARRRCGDCSRDELRRQQLRRVRYVWFDLGGAVVLVIGARFLFDGIWVVMRFEWGKEFDALGAGAKRPFEYGRTHVVRPKGAHKATIVWLHGLGDNGARYGNRLTFPLDILPPHEYLSYGQIR